MTETKTIGVVLHKDDYWFLRTLYSKKLSKVFKNGAIELSILCEYLNYY